MATILGINDECTTCECCGKPDLKKTIILNVDGEVKRYGTDCAGALLYGKKSASNGKIALGRAAAVQMATDLISAGGDAKEVAKAICRQTGFGSYVYANKELWISDFCCLPLS